MFQSAARQLVRRSFVSSRTYPTPAFSFNAVGFHTSSRREEAITAEEVKPVEKKSNFHAVYGVPIGMMIALPVLEYDWFLLNEEVIVAISMIVFSTMLYKEVGPMVYESLTADAKQMLAEMNRTENEYITQLQDQLDELVLHENVVQDTKDIMVLKTETYEKLNAAGKIKPQHEFKAQIERMLAVVETEEKNLSEKAKIALMEEATMKVREKLLTDKKLQKLSLDAAIAQLTGKAKPTDIVKDTYLDYFKFKKSSKVDEVAESKAARDSVIGKLNAIASSENYFFRFDADGKPKMIV